jgi:hypothetical protein
LQAYRHSLQPSDAERRPEHFDCKDCLPPPARRVGLTLDPAKQRARLCVLPGFDTSSHPSAPIVKRVWMGRGPDRAREGKAGDWAAPNEPIEEMGCPGAWYRTAWCRSLDRYYRRRDDHGNRIDNPALTQCSDPLVHEAIQTLEAYEDAAHCEYMRRFYAEQQRKSKGGGK